MKRILTIAVSLLSCIAVNAQFAPSTSNTSIYNSNLPYNVGIGTVDPQAFLQINGDYLGRTLDETQGWLCDPRPHLSIEVEWGQENIPTTCGNALGANIIEVKRQWTGASSSVFDRPLTMSSTGSVNLGELTPSFNHRLTVAGDARIFDDLYVDKKVGINTTSPVSSFHMKNGTFLISGSNNYGEQDARLVIDNEGSTNYRFVSFKNNNGEMFRVDQDGTVWAQEVIVQLTPFPDYVFESSYDLMDLSELRRYIADNGHLPNVPSAVEIREKGMGVSDLLKVQMEKIEELTLYILDLKSQLDALEQNQ